MRWLVYGAGVLGSLYAARLHASGEDVTVLARGSRLAELRESGILLQSGDGITKAPVRVVDALGADDAYDVIIVLVRSDQIESVLPSLAAHRATPTILFMYNTVDGPDRLIDAVGRDRVVLGFAGAGGKREGAIVQPMILPRMLQATTVGELDGRSTPRIRAIAAAFTRAGFPTAISPNMDAWLKTHVALVGPIAYGFYMTGGNYELAKSATGCAQVIKAIREGFLVVRALGLPLTPPRMMALQWLPLSLLVPCMRAVMNTTLAELAMNRHAFVARSEMRALADDFAALAARAGVATPATNELCRYI
jgi:2-dehydropantoate 2-reductase